MYSRVVKVALAAVMVSACSGVGVMSAFAADPTQAVDDSWVIGSDREVVLPVLDNDQGDALHLAEVLDTPAHGHAAIVGDRIFYTSAVGYTGTDSFTYSISGADGGTSTATVTVMVVTPDWRVDARVERDTPTVVTCDDGGHPGLTPVAVVGSWNGDAAIQADDTVLYTPAAGFTGEDWLYCSMEDATGQRFVAVVRVWVTVTISDPPMPTPQDDAVRIPKDSEAAICVTCNDKVGGTWWTLRVSQAPVHGAARLGDAPFGASIVYIPEPGFVGNDSFEYEFVDISGGSDAYGGARVSVEVVDVQAPVKTIVVTTSHNTPVLATVTDSNLAEMKVIAVTGGAHGKLIYTSGGATVQFVPDPGFMGTTSFTWWLSEDIDWSKSDLTVVYFPVLATVYVAGPFLDGDGPMVDAGGSVVGAPVGGDFGLLAMLLLGAAGATTLSRRVRLN